ncbi:MAG: sulfatase [Verrucomicrobiaceae bacterium]|nr:sulfatase [Verrucomicrobiaceae bacterium]
MTRSLASLLLFIFLPSSIRASDKPNVILFLVDDMGWMDCGAYGSQYYETPRMDAFAKKAMRFTNAYAQPLCSPTRCSLLTGKYSARHGITSATGHKPPQPADFKFLPDKAASNQPMLTPESKNYMEPSEYTLAEVLHDAGYRTAHIGKWHLGLTQPHWPEQQGFDVAFHCHPDPGPPGNYFSPYAVKPDGEPKGQQRVGTITDGPAGEYIVDRLADEAVKFINSSKAKGQPFFLNLWNYGVHGPWGHKLEYTKLFMNKKDPRGVQGNPIMASMLRSVDECFGRILDELDKLGIADNTIVIFNSDNGGNTHSNLESDPKQKRKAAKKSSDDEGPTNDWQKWAGNQPPTINTPLRDGKGTLYEGGTRVPLMWRWPGHINGGTTSDAVVGHIDVYPTVLDLIGIAKRDSHKIDGVSYASVLKGSGQLERQAFFNYFPHGKSIAQAGGVWVRSGVWKLIRWFGAPVGDEARYELYNLHEDLSETKNLAAAQAARVKELDALIDGFLTDTGATYPRPNPDFQASTATKKKPNATPAVANDDPLENWKARSCDAVVKDGVLTATAKGKTGTAFLGHGTGNLSRPAVVKARLRSAADGDGKVEWLPGGAADPSNVKSVPFSVKAGEWREISVDLAGDGPIGTLRIYLPASDKPVEFDWIELRSSSGKVKPMRWDFGGPKPAR